MFCAKCGAQIADGVIFCSFCGATQPPETGASQDRLKLCPSCNKPNWTEAKKCYYCNYMFEKVSQTISPTGIHTNLPKFKNISSQLPADAKNLLLSGEPAFAYVKTKGGCNSPDNQLLVTDSRVILEGQDTSNKQGCGGSGSLKKLDIPLTHVSSVSEETVSTGCSSGRGVGISSGSATLVVGVKDPKALEGAIRILQALIRAIHAK